MTPVELAVASFVIGIGAVVQGSVGFGLNLIAAPILVIIDPRLVPGPTLVAALVLTIFVAWRNRAGVDLRGLRWAFAGRIPGNVAGAVVVALLPTPQLALAFAAAVLLAVGLSAGGWRVRRNAGTLLGAGALSGVMGTVSSIGGPPMALVYQHAAGEELRGTLSGFFVFGAALSIASLAAVGRFGVAEVQASGVLLPGLVVGFWVSRWTAPFLDRGLVRPLVLGLSAASAVAVIVRYVL